MNPYSENAARLALSQQAASLVSDGLDPLGSGTLSMRWRRSGADGLLMVSVSACEGLLSSPQTDDATWRAKGMTAAAAPDDVGDESNFPVMHDAEMETEWLSPEAADLPECGGNLEQRVLDQPVWHPQQDGALTGLHGGIYAQRPDVGAVALLASPFAATLACSRDVQLDGIPFFHPMVALSGRTNIVCCPADVYAVLAGARDDGDRAQNAAFADGSSSCSAMACLDSAQKMVLDAMGSGNACLIAHYGLLTVGPNPRAAVSLARQIETLCRIYWQALQVSGARVMPIRGR
ncbi:MAG: class II aldolase/adducin family protein [Lautropia sp.]|nr:class II aldolase/adducin family protein [Lautropia sp.]